jgi:hypothetical protein
MEPDGPQFFWLNGLAGTGKSTVARTICQQAVRKDNVSLASFFISRHVVDRRDALNIFHTLVYQLAERNATMRHAVCDVLRAEPSLTKKGLGMQVSKLFSPLLLLVPRFTRIVIVIDALDECDKDDRDCEAGELIPLLMRALRAAPYQARFLITSRVENSIRSMFDEITGGTPEQMTLRLHEIDRCVVRGDLDRYFRHHLRRIALRDRNRCADDWPGDSAFEKLLDRTGVLFVYAATVVRFLDNPDFAPRMLLQRVLDASNPSAPATYQTLDALYTHVLATAASSNGAVGDLRDLLAERIRHIIGTIVCLQQPLSSNELVALMDLDDYETRHALGKLGAVLIFENDEPVRIFHPSFPDFLANPTRCQDGRFALQVSERHSQVTFRCLVFMNERLRYDICGSGKPWLHNDEVVHLVGDIKDLGPLSYACMYWAAHLPLASTPDKRLEAELASFCDQHLLHWIELLSLIGKLPCIDEYLQGALDWCQVNTLRFPAQIN